MVEKSLRELNMPRLPGVGLHLRRAWEDQVLYFPDVGPFFRWTRAGLSGNDGQLVSSGSTPLFQPADAENAVQSEADADRWREAGTRWAGGTLKGLASKIGYLKRLGVQRGVDQPDLQAGALPGELTTATVCRTSWTSIHILAAVST